MRPTIWFVTTLITLILIVISLWIIASVYSHALDQRAEIVLSKGWTPPMLDCDGDTWECMREAKYK